MLLAPTCKKLKNVGVGVDRDDCGGVVGTTYGPHEPGVGVAEGCVDSDVSEPADCIRNRDRLHFCYPGRHPVLEVIATVGCDRKGVGARVAASKYCDLDAERVGASHVDGLRCRGGRGDDRVVRKSSGSHDVTELTLDRSGKSICRKPHSLLVSGDVLGVVRFSEPLRSVSVRCACARVNAGEAR